MQAAEDADAEAARAAERYARLRYSHTQYCRHRRRAASQVLWGLCAAAGSH